MDTILPLPRPASNLTRVGRRQHPHAPLHCLQVSLAIARSRLAHNFAELGHGGALLLEGGLGSLTLTGGSIFANNSASGFGGAVAVGAAFVPGFSLPAASGTAASGAFGAADALGELVVEGGSLVQENRALLGGGGVFVNGSLGVLVVSGDGSGVSGNVADWGSGGAVLVAGRLGALTLSGGGGGGGRGGAGGGGSNGGAGGDAAVAATVAAGFCTLCGNSAYDSGGAIYVAGSTGSSTGSSSTGSGSTGSSSTGSSTGSSSTGNSAGGSSSVAAGVVIEVGYGARVEDNTAVNGAGGALCLTGAVARLRVAGPGTRLLRNAAALTGGAVMVRQGGVSGSITLADGAVVANCSARKGGAFKVIGQDQGSGVVHLQNPKHAKQINPSLGGVGDVSGCLGWVPACHQAHVAVCMCIFTHKGQGTVRRGHRLRM